MATARKSAPKPAGTAGEGIRVTARSPQGIRRAGRHWPPAEVVLPLSDLTKAELEALEEEPGLLTARCALDAEGKLA